VAPRRQVVDINKCNGCHSYLSLHGENRNQIEMCVLCHNPSENDISQRTNPNASPAEVQKATADATERIQQMLKAIPTDELLDAMVPVYQNYLSHSDIKAINEFYGSPTGQKLLKNTNAMTIDAMQAAQSVMKKHMAEIQSQIEKTAADESRTTSAQPK